MNTGACLSDDQIRDLIRRCAGLDLGDWEQGDIERVLTEMGWSLAEKEIWANRTFFIKTGLPTGNAYA